MKVYVKETFCSPHPLRDGISKNPSLVDVYVIIEMHCQNFSPVGTHSKKKTPIWNNAAPRYLTVQFGSFFVLFWSVQHCSKLEFFFTVYRNVRAVYGKLSRHRKLLNNISISLSAYCCRNKSMEFRNRT